MGICKKIILAISLVVLVGSMSEGVVRNLLDNPGFEEGTLGFSLTKPWVISDDGGINNSQCAYIDYQEEFNHKTIKSDEVFILSNKYYRLSAWCRSDIKDENSVIEGLLLYATGDTGDPIFTYTAYNVYPIWKQITHYFFSKTMTSTKLCLFAQDYGPGKIWVDDIELVEVTDTEFKNNLVVNPDFEQGEDGKLPGGWNNGFAYKYKDKKNPAPPITLDTNAGFIKGTKSLKIDGTALKEGDNAGVKSYDIPAVAGKDYVYSIWLKAKDDETTVQLWADGYYATQKKHYWRGQNIKITTEWRKYSFDVHVPGPDEDEYVSGRLLHLRIGLIQPGIIWVDEVKFMQK